MRKTHSQFSILAIILVVFISLQSWKRSRKMSAIEKHKLYEALDSKYDNIDQLEDLYCEMLDSNIVRADIVLTQVILETGYLKSYGARKRNNLSGFIWKGKHKEFSSRSKWISYYKTWQTKWMSKTSVDDAEENYYEFLNNMYVDIYSGDTLKYCPEIDYISKLESVKSRVSDKLISTL